MPSLPAVQHACENGQACQSGQQKVDLRIEHFEKCFPQLKVVSNRPLIFTEATTIHKTLTMFLSCGYLVHLPQSQAAISNNHSP